MTKQIFTPHQIANFYLHKPTLTSYKWNKIEERGGFKSKYVNFFNRIKGQKEIHTVANVDAILLGLFRDGLMILNGTHRSLQALKQNLNLVGYIANNYNNLYHEIPKNLFQEHSLEHMKNKMFMYSEEWFFHCKQSGRTKVKDLYENPVITHYNKDDYISS